MTHNHKLLSDSLICVFSFRPDLQLDKCVITAVALGEVEMRNRSLVKRWCQPDLVAVTGLLSAATFSIFTCR